MNALKNLTPRAAFVTLLLAWAVSFLVSALATMLIWMLGTGLDFKEFNNLMLQPKYSNMVKGINVVGAAILFLFPALVYGYINSNNPLKKIGFSNLLSGKQVFIVVVITIVGLALAGSLGELNKLIPLPAATRNAMDLLENNYVDQILVMAKMNGLADLFTSLLVIALIPAITEEVFFRGALQQAIGNLVSQPFTAIIITAAMFSLIHFSWYGFLPRLGLGIVLGCIYYYSKNIWLPILAHFLNNAFAVLQLYVLQKNGILTKAALLQSMNDTMPIWYGLFALVLLVNLFIHFRKESLLLYSMQNNKE